MCPKPAPETAISLSLTGQFHLACIDGIDIGRVLPLQARVPLGRALQPPLQDQTTSRIQAKFEPSGRFCIGTLQNLGTNPLQGRLLTHQKLCLRVGTRIKIGQNLWQVRKRPARLLWQVPNPAEKQQRGTTRKWLMWLPLGFLLLAVTRWLPLPGVVLAGFGVSIAGIAVVLGIHAYTQLKRQDGAALALALRVKHSAALDAPVGGSVNSKKVPGIGTGTIGGGSLGTTRRLGAGTELGTTSAASVARNAATVETVAVRLRPGGFRKIVIRNGDYVGIAGKQAENTSWWLVGQLAATLPARIQLDSACHTFGAANLPATIVLTQANPSQTLPVEQQLPALTMQPTSEPWARIVWAQEVSELPESCTLVLPGNDVRLVQNWLPACLPVDSGESLPSRIEMTELLFSPKPAKIAAAWESPQLCATLGMKETGQSATVDLLADGPHSLLVGCTGSGKTEALLTWILSLCAKNPPSRLKLVLLDYKGGSGLKSLAELPHVEYFSTDLAPADTAWVLTALQRVLQKRKRELTEAGYKDLRYWEEAGGAPSRLLVVADEFRFLADKHPQYLQHLLLLASQGRALGMHLVLATQRLGGAVNSDMRAVIDNRVALRCMEEQDSLEAIGSPAAATLPRIPGRGLYQGEQIQVALAENLDQWVQAMQVAAEDLPVSPVLPPQLPASLSPAQAEILPEFTERHVSTAKSSSDKIVFAPTETASGAQAPSGDISAATVSLGSAPTKSIQAAGNQVEGLTAAPSTILAGVVERQSDGQLCKWGWEGTSLSLLAPPGQTWQCQPIAAHLAAQTRKPVYWLGTKEFAPSNAVSVLEPLSSTDALAASAYLLETLPENPISSESLKPQGFTLVLVNPHQLFDELESKAGASLVRQTCETLRKTTFHQNATIILVNDRPCPHLNWIHTTLLRIAPGTCEQQATWLTKLGISIARLNSGTPGNTFTLNPAWEHANPLRFAGLQLDGIEDPLVPVQLVTPTESKTETSDKTTTNRTDKTTTNRTTNAIERTLEATGICHKPNQAGKQNLVFTPLTNGYFPYPTNAKLVNLAGETQPLHASAQTEPLTIIAPQPETLATALNLQATKPWTTTRTTPGITTEICPTHPPGTLGIKELPNHPITPQMSPQKAGDKNVQIKTLHPHEWVRCTPTATSRVLAIEPRPELVRLLSSASFRGNLPALAALPYRPGTGLWLQNGKLQLVSIQPQTESFPGKRGEQLSNSHPQTLA